MQTYISILRGINVSGHRKIAMKDLSALYTSLGFQDVRTYIQSGNVLFRSRKADVAAIARQIEKAIVANYEFEVPVLVIAQEELKDFIRANPFLKEKDIETDKLHVTFLSGRSGKPQLDKIAAFSYPPDRFLISGRVVYVYCPGGYGNTKLNNNFFENKLGLTATTRNWKTVNELARLAETTGGES